MKLTRREFGNKLANLAAAGLIGTLAAFTASTLTGCADAVIAALDVASAVAKSAAGIIASVSPRLNAVLLTIAADLAQVVGLYKQYDSSAGDKPTTFQLIQATLSTITNNLSEILSAIHVFNPALTVIVKTAVAIMNTAISLIISHLPQPHQSQARLQRLNMAPLPSIDGAKSANDLKKAWNDAVKAEHPEAVIR